MASIDINHLSDPHISFIHSRYLYSAPSRNLLRGALSPATANEKCLKKLAEGRRRTRREAKSEPVLQSLAPKPLPTFMRKPLCSAFSRPLRSTYRLNLIFLVLRLPLLNAEL